MHKETQKGKGFFGHWVNTLQQQLEAHKSVGTNAANTALCHRVNLHSFSPSVGAQEVLIDPGMTLSNQRSSSRQSACLHVLTPPLYY